MNKTVNILSFVLDDDKDILLIIEDLLKENSITNYRLFHSDEEFLNSMTQDIHVCVIDHFLTGKQTGLDVCRKTKARNKNSFIIVMSGQRDPDVIIAYLNECADKYVDKNKKDYLKTLIDYLKVGIETVVERLERMEKLEHKINAIRERRKQYE